MQFGRIKVLGLPIRIAIAVIIIGSALKVLHFQNGELIMTIGFSAVLILYAIRFYKKTNKVWNDTLKLVFVSAWCLNGIFTVFHLPYRIIFQSVTSLSFIVLLFTEGITYFESTKSTGKSMFIASTLFILASLFILIGIIFKIMHWPNANTIITIGFLMAILWVFKDFLLKK